MAGISCFMFNQKSEKNCNDKTSLKVELEPVQTIIGLIVKV